MTNRTTMKTLVLSAAVVIFCFGCKVVSAAGQVFPIPFYKSSEEQRLCADLNIGCPLYLVQDDQVPSIPHRGHFVQPKPCTPDKDCELASANPGFMVHRCPRVKECGDLDPTKAYALYRTDCKWLEVCDELEI